MPCAKQPSDGMLAWARLRCWWIDMSRWRAGPSLTGEHGTSPTNLASQRWFDRLPDRPQLEHLGLGLGQTGSTAYPRITALIAHLCASQGCDPDEFVGYRCEVAYPVWGVQYLVSFDFGDGEES